MAASEQDPAARAEWQSAAPNLRVEDLVVIDETGTTIAMTRRYARSPRGQRANARVPRNHGKSTSLVAAFTVDGIGEAMSIEGAIDGVVFQTFLDKYLCPSLRPGQIVVMDNLSVHKSAKVREMIEARGCQLLFLPPYSPDFSPIELAFSKIKQFLRKAAARTQSALDLAIASAIDTVTSSDALAWFRHCGYRLA
jgi:transposase